jgi:sulfur carrier protein
MCSSSRPPRLFFATFAVKVFLPLFPVITRSLVLKSAKIGYIPPAMKLQINGEETSFETTPGRDPLTLAALVEFLAMKSDRVAVELNREIVPRDRWAATALKDGDRLEIVHFVGGGTSPNTYLSS